MPIIIVLFGLFSGLVVLEFFLERRRLLKLCSSGCTGRLWRRAFVNTSKQDLRAYFDVVHAAFGLADRYRLRLAPNVKLMDLYHVTSPAYQGFDALELETFSLLLEDRFGTDPLQDWRTDLTLGEVFARTQPSAGSQRDV